MTERAGAWIAANAAKFTTDDLGAVRMALRNADDAIMSKVEEVELKEFNAVLFLFFSSIYIIFVYDFKRVLLRWLTLYGMMILWVLDLFGRGKQLVSERNLHKVQAVLD